MERVAKFEKVSNEQFKKDYIDTYRHATDLQDHEEWLKKVYDEIKLPQRATVGSAGYDFYSPFNMVLLPSGSVVVPTGIRVKIDDGWVLKCYPRSGLGSKYRLQLNNTVGIIDSDYYNAKNEGHIFAKLTYDLKPEYGTDDDFQWIHDNKLCIDSGKAFMQGVFVEYGITVDDNTGCERTGGFGSTDK